MNGFSNGELATVHSTDLSFMQFCEKEFGINRGIYNTIDDWFFNIGIKNLLKRRKTIIMFLQGLQKRDSTQPSKKVKFGNGGLKLCLGEFWNSNPGNYK
jgi:riboflavin kinase